MYRSIYQTLKPKMDARATGVLKLLHASGRQGTLALENGKIISIIQDELTGIDAAKAMLRWVNMAIIFDEGQTAKPQELKIKTESALTQLEKIHARVSLIKEHIGGCDAVFQFIGQQIMGSQQFSPQELNLSFLMDGKASIKEVLQNSQLSELDTLMTICKFIKHKLVRVVRPHRPMDEARRTAFLEELENILSEITGPVASVIINDAFEAIGAPAEELAECDTTHLYEVISSHLEDDEREEFVQWTESIEL